MPTTWYDAPLWQDYTWSPTTPQLHSGVDLGMPTGTPLTALLPGLVVSAGMEPWGGQVNIQSDWPGIGPIIVSYLHASKLLVRAGDTVKPGQMIALSGVSPAAYSVGGRPNAHLHFEVSRGTVAPYMGHRGPSNPIDPKFLIQAAQSGTLGHVAPVGAVGAVTQSAVGVAQTAKHAPGFFPVIQAIDRAERISGLDPLHPAGSVLDNARAILIRGIVVGLGVVILLLVIWNLIRGPVSAGVDVAAKAAPAVLAMA